MATSVNDPLERLTNLVAFLVHSERPVTQAQIVVDVPGYPPGEAGRRTFERDKRVLRDEGLPLREDKGLYSIRADEFFLPELDLTDDERAALAVAVAAVPLAGLGPADVLAKLGGMGERFVASPAVADLEEMPELAVLHSAARERAVVTFTHGDSHRTVEPHGLIFRDGWWYVVGHDRTRDERRTFRVDRMRDVVVGDPGAFEPPEHLDMEGAVPRGAGQPVPGETPVEAVVVVDKVLARKVEREISSIDMKERADGSFDARLLVSHPESFRSWLLGLLDHAEIREPAALREDVVSWLRAIAGDER